MVRFSYLLTVAVILLSFSISGCSEEPAPTAPAKPIKSVKKKAAAPVVQQPAAVVENEVASYEYRGAGRRDPFAPLSEEKKPVIIRDTRPLEPLEKFDLKQLRLEAVLLGFGAPRAMIKAPDGKSYIVRPGNRMGKNRGEIKAIDKSSVVLSERYQDFSGAVRTGEKRIELPKREGL